MGGPPQRETHASVWTLPCRSPAVSTRCQPQPLQLYMLGGSIEFKAGNTGAAQALFMRAHQLDPRNKQLYMEWPRLEAALGDEERARALFQRGASLHPSNLKILNLWAHWEESVGNIGDARTLHRRALMVGAGPAAMHNRVSWASMEAKEGDLEAARALLLEGLDLHPDWSAALVLLASVERRAGRLDIAEAHLRHAQRISGSHGVAVLDELRALHHARGEHALAANLRRHVANVESLHAAKRAGAWGSEAWAGYYAANAQHGQRTLQMAARARKRELAGMRTARASAAGDGWELSGSLLG